MPGPKKSPSSKTIAKEVVKTLETLYPETPIPLQHEDAYTLLIAVLLSAQCTDERVNKVTPLLFAKANNPTDMIKLDVKEIESIIRPCGLSRLENRRQYLNCRKYYSKNTMVRFPNLSKHLRNFLALGTKRLR